MVAYLVRLGKCTLRGNILWGQLLPLRITSRHHTMTYKLISLPFALFVLLSVSHVKSNAINDIQQERPTKSPKEIKQFERLPKNVVPSNYKITLEPDLVNLKFTGEEIIKINIKEETKKIILNSLDLVINEDQVSYTPSDGNPIKPDGIQLTPENQRLIITFASPLKPGTSGDLKISFSGILNDKLKGFYRARYPQGEGKPDKWAAVTQFETTSARMAFPCWDEPAIKATFEITVVAPADQVCLSNMPVVAENNRTNGKKEVQFAVSPIMSTYLVAIVVGEFEYIETKTTDGKVTVRVYAPPGKKEQGQFALEVASKTLPFYSNYFKIDYPLPKMDLIAISDFAAGAMENWGLVTYRETALLVDPKNTPADRKQLIAIIVAHELAHQWFGNLVTMEWWTHLWLNEGFATFAQHLCVDNLFPEFEIWKSFVISTLSGALKLDALHNSHPIEVPINDPTEIDEIFDSISYGKGASVIRMLYHWLGDDNFRKGMNLYLTRHKYQNAQTEDLWTALGEASSKPVREVMTTWTTQMGFPLISASQIIHSDNRVVHVSQEKFSADGKLTDDEKQESWIVPLTMTSASYPNTSQSFLLYNKSADFVLPNVQPNDWIKVNHESVGFYRVKYSASILQQLVPEIRSKTLPPLDRLSIQDNLYALVQSGKVSTVELLKLLENYKDENEYIVWSSISSSLGGINALLSFTDFQDAYHVYGRHILSEIYKKVGLKPKQGESHSDVLLRNTILNRLAVFDEPSFAEEAKKLFDNHAKGTLDVPIDIRDAVYSAVARSADEKVFDTFFRLYRETDQQEERNRLSGAMGSFPDIEMLKKVLAFAISDQVRSQDSVSVISSVANNKLGRDLAWNFFKDNAKFFKDRYSGGLLLARLVKAVTSNFGSEEKAKEIESYFAENPFPGTERSLKQSLEGIRLTVNWLARDAEDIKKFLTKSRV